MSKPTDGFDQLGRKFIAIGQAARGRVIRQAANYAMTPVQKSAASLAPKGTQPHKTYKGRVVAPGFLSRSIKKRTSATRDKAKVFAKVGFAPEAFYGMYLHHEVNRKQKKVPFLVDAYSMHRQTLVDRFADKMRKGILRAAK